MDNYAKIGKYCRILPGFERVFTLAKFKSHFYPLYICHTDDLLQEIALSMLETGGWQGVSNNLSRHLYRLAKGLLPDQQFYRSQAGKPAKKTIPPLSTCESCGRTRREYLRGGWVPGKRICGMCAQKIRREDRRRNAHD